MSTINQSDVRVTVTIDGKPWGAFDKRTGGDVDSDINKRRTAYGEEIGRGRPTVADIGVTRGYDKERDHVALLALEARCGRASISISEQPLDEDGIPWGKPRVKTGVVKSVDYGDVDVNSGDPRDYTITATVKADA